MTFKSSNSEWVESLSTEKLVEHIRLAMSEGCIKPAHVYDLVDESLQRLSESTNSRPKQQTLECIRCRKTKDGCEFLDPLDGKTCRAVCYPTYPPQYDKCEFVKD